MTWVYVSKKILKWGAITIGILVLSVFVLFGIIQTETGRQSLVHIAERVLADGNRKVEIGTITGVVPFRFQLERMSLADDQGTLFTLGGLEFEWSPWPVLKGDIHVRKMKSAFFHLERTPQDKGEKDDSLQLPRWLAVFDRLRIDHLSVDELVLGESVVGERATFRLQSDLKAAFPGAEWAAHLVLDRTDGPEARLRLNASIRENGRFLVLDAEGQEAQEGLLSRRAGISGPFAFSIRGEGPLTEWKGGMEASAGGAGLLKAQILASYSDGIRLDMEGFAEPEGEFLSAFLGDVPAGRILFNVRGGLGRDGQLYIDHLSLESGEAGLKLSGSSDLEDETLKAKFQFRHTNLKKMEKGLHLPIEGTVILDGHVSGTIRNPSAVLSVELVDLKVERTSVSGLSGEIHVGFAGEEQGDGSSLRFKGDGRIKGLSIRGMDRVPERDLQWGFSGERFFSGHVLLQSLLLKGEKNSLRISGKIDPATWDGAFDVEADTKELSRLLKGAGSDFPDDFLLKAGLDGNFKRLSFSGDLKGKLKPEVGKGKGEERSRETGVRSQKAGVRKPEIGDQRSEVGKGKAEGGRGKAEERRQETGVRRQEIKSEVSKTGAVGWVERSETHLNRNEISAWLLPILREGLDVSARFSLDQGQKLSVSEMRLKSPSLFLSASGAIDLYKRRGTSTAHLQLHDLNALSSAAEVVLGGNLEASATLEGSPERLTLSTEIRGNEVRAGTVSLGTVKLALNAAGKLQANDGTFLFEAGGKTEGVSGEGLFSLKGERFSLTKIQLSGPGNTRARGNLDFDLATKLAQGELAGECPDLSGFSSFVNQPLKGKVDFNAQLGKGGNKQQLNLAFSGAGLKSPAFEGGEIRIKARLTELSGNPRGNASLESKNLRMQGVHASSLKIRAEGDGNEISFNAKAKGEVDRSFDLETEGLFHPLRQEGSFLKISRFQGRYGDLPFRMPKSFEIIQSAGEISADNLQLVLGSGRLSGRGRLGSEEVDLSVQFEDLPLNLVRPAGKVAIEGSGSGEVELKGRQDRPEGTTRIRLTGLRGRDPQLKGMPPAVLEARAGLRGQRLELQLSLRGVTTNPFEVNMELPLQLSLYPFHASFPEEEMSGDLNGKADLSRLGIFLGLDDQSMSGVAEVELHLEGTPAQPKVTGSIGVENGGYENARSGTLLKDVDILLNAGTRGLVIEKATASDGEEGTAVADGWLEVDPAKDFPFQVGVTFEKLKLIRHDWGTAGGKGRAQLKGSFSNGVLSGNVQVETGEFRIPDRLPPDIPDLEVTEINGPNPTMTTSPERTIDDDPYLDFDLRLKSDGHFFVRGRGLESEWAGELRLTGTSDEPAITGDLSVERGRFNFMDKRFTLTQGKITFNGMAHPSPFLDVMAESNAKDMTAHLHLVGPLRAPEIKLSSDPPFPTDEVLSRLLFGQSMNRISPLQAIQLAQTLNAMRGRNSLDLLGTTRKLLKIDQLEVKQSGENNDETSIAAGKYLRDDVYIEVERSLGPGGTKASVEWELSPHVSVETEIGANAESGVGINWKWDY
jgi:autotransporter translocation and assembly factor TamB